MSSLKNTRPSGPEQKICVSCGMCCDGTIFLHASLNQGERGNLPEKIETNSFSEGGKDFFRLPCPYFSGKCSIYDLKRADVCSGYRCQLLKDYSDNKVTLERAMEIVRDTLALREKIFIEYVNLSGKKLVLSFKEIIRVIIANSDSYRFRERNEMLLGKCNILEALMIKHFRSESDFNNMME